MVLRNSIKVELLEDPISPVAFIIDRVPKEQLVNAYEIDSFADADDFLAQLARRRGRLGRGGEPDIDAVARMVLADWNHGRIRYFTLPPTGDDTVEGAAELVTAWGDVYPMAQTIDFGEKDFKNLQIQHVFEVVQRRRQAAAVETGAESDEEERTIVGPGMAPAEQEELNQLAEEYQTISFTGL